MFDDEAELETARDDRVCPICDELDGEVYVIGEDELPDIPLHPNCRCSLTDLETGQEIFAGALKTSSEFKGKKLKFKMGKGELKKGSIEVKDDRLYIKAFLLDSSLNLNDWGVTAASLEDNINSFIGKPLVLTENYDHPDIDDGNLKHVFANQEPYRIGTIIDVVKSGSRYDAIVEVTNQNAKQVLQSAKVPPFVSPAIYPLSQEPDVALSNWTGVHLAVVDDPAYGVKRAQIKDMCNGGSSCLVQLRKAHVEKHGYGCGFCVRKALEKLIIKTASAQSSSSQFTNKENSHSLDIKTGNMQECLDSGKSKEECEKMYGASQTAATTPNMQPELDKLKAENEILKQANEALKKASEETATRVAALEKEARKSKIASIITDEIIKDDKKRGETIDSLTALNLKDEDFAKAVSPLLEAAKIKIASTKSKFQYHNEDAANDNSHIAWSVGVS